MSKMSDENGNHRPGRAGWRSGGDDFDLSAFLARMGMLKIARFRLHFRASQQLVLPRYKGATFRGVFGIVFKTAARELGLSPAYRYVFETPNDGRLADYAGRFVPKPFVLEAPVGARRIYRPGEPFYVDLVLIGAAIDHAPEIIHIFDRAGRDNGVGKWRGHGFGRFRLEKAVPISSGREQTGYRHEAFSPGDGALTPPAGENLVMRFITPTHIRHGGVVIEKNEAPLTFEALVNSLCRRLYYLHCFHQRLVDTPLPQLKTPSVEIVDKRLSWEWVRYYSNRQRKRVPLGGFRGRVVFRGDWRPYYALLKLGERVHVGNETTFGFGKYRLGVNGDV